MGRAGERAGAGRSTTHGRDGGAPVSGVVAGATIWGSIPREGVAPDLGETGESRAAPTTGDRAGVASELDLMGLRRKKLERTGIIAIAVLMLFGGRAER